MRWLYTILIHIALPFILLRLFWRSHYDIKYRQRIAERFGIYSTSLPKGGIWVHAVSVGETIAAGTLIKKLLDTYPNLPIILTTMTFTGSDRARDIVKRHQGLVHHVYVPYDLPFAVRNFLRASQPKIAIILETELWPNIIHACYKRNIPSIIANARLSSNSMRGYQQVKKFTANTIKKISAIATQTEMDNERFLQLGANKDQLCVAGNIKFDIEIPPTTQQMGQFIRQRLGDDRPIWIAASTHDSEERFILSAHRQILSRLPEALLILVPRHPQRFDLVNQLCRNQGFKLALRSHHDTCQAKHQIYLGDTMGELLDLYAASNVAFVGGSLTDNGGHNPLEAASLGIPVLTGPHYSNFINIYDLLIQQEGVKVVNNSQELSHEILRLLQNPLIQQTMGYNGKRIVTINRGVSEKLVNIVDSYLT